MLYNGKTFWDRDVKSPSPYPQLEGDIECDVCIVGGGMSGILTARTLGEAGFDCVLLEADRIGQGSSLANTGMLQWANDKRLSECIDTMGLETGERFYQASYWGMRRLFKIAESLPLQLPFYERESVLYAGSSRDADMLHEEYEVLKARRYPVSILDRGALKEKYNLDQACALITKGDAEVNPFVFIQTVSEDAVSRHRLRIFEQSPCRTVRDVGEQIEIESENGGTVRADHLVFASGYCENELTDELGYAAELVRSYALVTKPLDSALETQLGAMFWETSTPYLYIRPCDGNRLLIGGLDEDWKTAPSDSSLEKAGQKLLKSLHKLFPNVRAEADAVWGARFGESADGLPFIGRLPGRPNQYMLLGYGGNGTAYSAVGSTIILNLIEGKDDPYAGIFDPARVLEEQA